jgi:hypothetical protein
MSSHAAIQSSLNSILSLQAVILLLTAILVAAGDFWLLYEVTQN